MLLALFFYLCGTAMMWQTVTDEATMTDIAALMRAEGRDLPPRAQDVGVHITLWLLVVLWFLWIALDVLYNSKR